MSTFFIGWELWVKLVFILGCAIGITILAAITKLLISHSKLRTLARQSMIQDEERILSSEVFRRYRVEEDFVPFGSVALREGIRTPGVWNSPATSRETSQDRSSLEYTTSTRSTSLSQQRPPVSLHTRFHARPEVTQLTANDLPQSSQSSPVDALDGLDSTHGVINGDCSLFKLQHPNFARAMAHIEAEYRASDPLEPNGVVHKMGGKVNHARRIMRRPTRRQSEDLSMLDRQRKIHAAEIGQFQPRSRSSRRV